VKPSSLFRASKGLLIKCDAASRQVLLQINQKMPFIIEDLDESHLFIEPTMLKAVKAELDRILDMHTYRTGISVV
ncbi:hypothetical protein GQ42DRAFT_163898, partial [Ramicandelaber brevisporus]